MNETQLDADSHPPQPLTKRQLFAHFARYGFPLALLGIAIHLILPQIASLEHSLQVVKSMALWAVAAAVTMQVFSYLGSGYIFRSIAKLYGKRLALIRSTIIFTAAGSIGLVVGGTLGSTAMTYRWMHESGVNKEGAVLAGWLPSLVGSIVLVFIAMFGVAHLLITHDLSKLQAIGFGVTLGILVLLTGLIWWGMGHRSNLISVVTAFARRWATLRQKTFDPTSVQATIFHSFDTWDSLRSGGWRGLVAGAVANIGFDIGTLIFVFVAAGHPVSPGVVLTGYGLPLLLGRVSFLPGGVGIVEGTMAALYDGLGVPDAVTVVVILIYRLISFWLPTLLGFPLIPYLQWAIHRESHRPN